MGYNLTRHSIRRNRPQLDQLYELKKTISFVTQNPHRLAYKLREAIAACGEFEELEDYHSVLSLYTIKVRNRSVLAEFSDVHIGVSPGKNVDEPDPIVVEPVRTEPGPLSLIDVLGEVVGNEVEEEIHFPNALLPPEDKVKLLDWTRQNPPWAFISHGDKGITITGLEVDPELLWSPEDETKLYDHG